jgi:hypothetical protein
MNNLTGHVVCFNESIGRYILELSSGEMLSLHPGNLTVARDAPVSEMLPAGPATAAPPPDGGNLHSKLNRESWLAAAVVLVFVLTCSLVSCFRTPTAAKPSFSPLGSFKDNEEARALRFGPLALGYDAAACSAACPLYKYFALQLNGFCSCDNDLLSVVQYGREECGPLGGHLCNYVYQHGNDQPGKPLPEHLQVDYYPPWRFWRYPHWRLRYWWMDWGGYGPDAYGGWWYHYYGWGMGLVSSLIFLGVCAVLLWQLGGGVGSSKRRARTHGWSLGNLWMRIESMNIWELFMYASLLERAAAILRRQFR